MRLPLFFGSNFHSDPVRLCPWEETAWGRRLDSPKLKWTLRHLTISSHVFFVTTCPRPSCHTRDSPFLTFLEFPDIDLFWHMRCD
jgi:hypothetical protein